jgi:putative endonuclease
MDKRASGRAGEDTAAAYLASLGYDVLQRNYYTRYGEIDIIANDGDWLVFTEVKKRKNVKYGTGAQAVTSKKIETIRLCASIYLAEHELSDQKVRFDVIEITGITPVTINHIKAAF